MNKKGQMPPIKILFAIIIIGILILVGFYIAGGFTIIKEIREQGKTISDNTAKVNDAISKLNNNLVNIEKIPSQVENIQTGITSLKDKISLINSDASQFKESEIKLQEDISKLNDQIKEFSDNLILLKEMQKEYPPTPIQNIVFSNATNEDVTKIITNVINQKILYLSISFVIGSLFGGISIYFIFRFFKNKGAKLENE